MGETQTTPSIDLAAQFEKLMKIKQLQIKSLLDISNAINNNDFPTAALLRIYEFVLKAQFSVPRLLVYIKDDVWELVCSSGIDVSKVEIDVEKDLLQFEQRTELRENGDKKFNDFDVIIPVKHNSQALAYALIGDLEADTKGTYDEQLEFIETITNIVIVAVENRKLVNDRIEQQVLKREMELAKEVQKSLVPLVLPDNEYINLAAVYKPHQDIGGDYYDAIELNDHETVFCLGDIAGKGMSAALLMANFQAILRTLIENEYKNLENMAQFLNDRVVQITKGERFISFFLGIYDHNTRVLRYLNAGHNPPLFYSNGTITELKDGCTLLGMFDELPFVTPGEIQVKEEAVLLTYTDGIIDTENAEGEFYGVDRLVDFLKANQKFPVDKINSKLMYEITEFKGEGGSFLDDITLLTTRFF